MRQFIPSAHHWMEVNGHLVHHKAPYRYIFPSELELMGRVAGLRLVQRWAGWRREKFTADSTNPIAVFESMRSGLA